MIVSVLDTFNESSESIIWYHIFPSLNLTGNSYQPQNFQ